MENVQIDWLAVVIAAVLNIVVGSVWYSKWLFGKMWQKFSHISEGEIKKNKMAYFWELAISFVIAYFLAFFEGYLGVTTVSDGMFVGFCLWLGFVATTQASSIVWRRKPFQVFLINTGGKLLSYLVMGGVIGA